jgi:hypothetical protein
MPDAGDAPFYLLNVPVDQIADHAKFLQAIRVQFGATIPAAVVIDTEPRRRRPAARPHSLSGAVILSRLDHVEVGRDSDGADHVESRTRRRRDDRSGQDRRHHQDRPQPVEALVDAGQATPASNHIPRGVKTVPIGLWPILTSPTATTRKAKPEHSGDATPCRQAIPMVSTFDNLFDQIRERQIVVAKLSDDHPAANPAKYGSI